RCHHRALPSFPTRRSSDLFTVTAWTAAGRAGADFCAVAAGLLAGAAFGAVGDVEVRRGVWVADLNQGTHLASNCSARSSSVLVRSEEHTSELQSRSDLVCR